MDIRFVDKSTKAEHKYSDSDVVVLIHGKGTKFETPVLQCKHCNFNTTKAKVMNEHLAEAEHNYEFEGGVNPFVNSVEG